MSWEDYISPTDTAPYKIYTKQLLPAVSIGSESVDKVKEFNNMDYWTIKWYRDSEEADDIKTVDCKELINSWTDIAEGERESLLEEIDLQPFPMLCPNVTSFEVSSGEFATKSLGMSLDRTQAGLDFDGVHGIYSVEIS